NTTGRSLGEVNSDIQRKIATLSLPAGYHFSAGGAARGEETFFSKLGVCRGEVRDQQKFFSSLVSALGLAVLLMYLILVVQFGSFLDPLAIMMSLPLSLIGVLLALAVSGMTVNLMSLIGVILLMGIGAKNEILRIDFAQWASEKE